MFANDLLIFGEATEKQVLCVIETFEIFCKISGQEINKEKSSMLFSKNVSKRVRAKLANLATIKETDGFGKYLGIPLTGKAIRKKDFVYVLDQIVAKLASWKARHLSFDGRVTIAKSEIEAIPVYPMMTNLLHVSYIKDIQRIQ